MLQLPKDVLDKIEEDFGTDSNKAMALLEKYARAEPQISLRIYRSIVYVAYGDLNELKDAIELALTDWRDLIMWAEYEGPDLQSAIRLRNFNNPFPDNKKNKTI